MKTLQLTSTIKKVIFILGVCLITILIILFKIDIEFAYNIKHLHALEYYSWLREINKWWIFLEWSRLILYALFLIGIVLIVSPKKYVLLFLILSLFPEVISILQKVLPDSFNYSYTAESFSVGLYTIHLLQLLVSAISFIILTNKTSEDLYKHGLTLFSVVLCIPVIFQIGMGILFSIDSTYFVEKFPTFFTLRTFFYNYLQHPLLAVAFSIINWAIYKDAYKEITAEDLLAS